MKTEKTTCNKNFLVVNLSVILMLIAMMIGNIVNAQPPGGGQGGGQQGPPPIPNTKQIKKMVAGLSEELSLNGDLETKVLEIYEDHFSEVEELVSAGRPDRQKMEALDSALQKNVNAMLTEEQQKLFAAWLKKNKRQRGGQRPSR